MRDKMSDENILDIRRIQTTFLSLLFFFVPLYSISGESGLACDDEGQFTITIIAENLNESRLKGTIERDGRVEIIYTVRTRSVSGNQALPLPRTREIQLRKTGFRDLITGDLVLMVNGRETASFRSWDRFFRDFSFLEAFPLEITRRDAVLSDVQYRVEVVYKKFVAPLNLLYLIPGKYISRGKWITPEEQVR